ncbi:MAG: RsmB/NOP family class I SAM-dependent RNA methyltransferase [Paracoccaceae bacterium]
MTPSARISAAIELLDGVIAGGAAERLLTAWARANRYAGSGDRAAIRDLVYDALRCRRSFGWLGGGDSGRGLMIGLIRARGDDPDVLFSGGRFAPMPLSEAEGGRPMADAPREVRRDCPDWLLPHFDAALGDTSDTVLDVMRHRAPVFLRVHLGRITRDGAIATLADEGIDATAHPLSPSALEVTHNARRIAASSAYRDGLVELQDAASQAVVDLLPLAPDMRVLDYCAGGGGKLLAMAARAPAIFTAHDAEPRRMRDLPARAQRAGLANVALAAPGTPGGAFDLVLCDAPCSGSGAWRRAPQAKWDLTPDRLAQLVDIQAEILDHASALVALDGVLAYATCSLFARENHDQTRAFLARHSGWHCAGEHVFTPLDGGDGFYLALLARSQK